MLKQRVITALILIPLVLVFLYYASPYTFFYITAFVMLLAAWEGSNLIRIKPLLGRFLYLIVILLCMFATLFIAAPLIFMITGVWWCLATLLVVLYPRAIRCWDYLIVRMLMGVMVLVPSWLALNYLRNLPMGFWKILFLFAIIWGADSAAYFAGKKWGKTKLAPRVSPGKSIQGLIGAFLFVLILTFLILWLANVPHSIWLFIFALATITVIASLVGDLFESMLKRQAGLKDSGHLLPGHGGLLDRIDSLTAAAPIYTLGLWYLSLHK